MLGEGAGRTIAAIIASYATNAILVAVTEQLLASPLLSSTLNPRIRYFVVDLITQCFYTVITGYLCCVIARPTQRAALAGLIGLALCIGAISLITSWKSEPHWYGIALLCIYAPCAWAGWKLQSPANVQAH